jgi:hypothetical protein
VGRGDDLQVRKLRADELHELALPHRVQVKVDLVDEQEAPGRERIGEVLEHIRDLEQQVAGPGGDVLIPLAQQPVRNGAVRRRENQLPALAVDVEERDPRE